MAEYQLDDPLLVALRRARPRGGDDAVADGPKARDLLARVMANGLVVAAPEIGRHKGQRVKSGPPAPPLPGTHALGRRRVRRRRVLASVAAFGGSGRGPRRVRLGRYRPRAARVLSAAASLAVVAGGAGLATAFAGGAGTHLDAAREVMVTPVKVGKGPVHIRLADFSVDTQANGAVMFTVGEYGGALDPSALRQALARAGVPALVTVGTQCQTAGAPYPAAAIFPPPPVPPPGAVLNPTLTPTPVPAGRFVPPKPGTPIVWYVAPSAIPAGTEVSFAFTRSLDAMFTGLVTIGQKATCSTTFNRFSGPNIIMGPVPGLWMPSPPTPSSPATTTASSGPSAVPTGPSS